jgi:hypothetical protein
MSTTSVFRCGKFVTKKAPQRKATTISPLQMTAAERAKEFGLDYNNAHMQLGEKEFKFDPDRGEWYEEGLIFNLVY